MKRVLTCIFAALIFAVFAGLYGAANWFEYNLLAIAVWAAMIAAVPLSSFLHELGHMLVGAMCGIKTKPRFNIFGSSSCALMPKKDTHMKSRFIWTAYGGIFMNLIIAGVCNFLIAIDVAPVWLSFLIPANFYLVVLNSIPVQFQSGKTDGLVALDLLNNTDEAKVMLAVMTAQAQILNGKKIEDIEESLLFGLPQIREDDQSFIVLTELRYEYFKAKGEEEKAEECRKRFEELKIYI